MLLDRVGLLRAWNLAAMPSSRQSGAAAWRKSTRVRGELTAGARASHVDARGGERSCGPDQRQPWYIMVSCAAAATPRRTLGKAWGERSGRSSATGSEERPGGREA